MPISHDAMRAAARSALWLLLGAWLGAWASFGLIVVPIAFSVLPSTEIAGQLVRAALAALNFSGAATGVALACLARALGRGGWHLGLPLALAAVCLVSHFGVSAELSEIRGLAFGPPGDPEAMARFARLHRISVGLFAAVGAGAAGLAVLHSREAAASG